MNSIAPHTLVYRQLAASPPTPLSRSLDTHAAAAGHHPSRRQDVTHLRHMQSSRNLWDAAVNKAVAHKPVAAETAPAVCLTGTGQAPPLFATVDEKKKHSSLWTERGGRERRGLARGSGWWPGKGARDKATDEGKGGAAGMDGHASGRDHR